jgi:hypothetical protein
MSFFDRSIQMKWRLPRSNGHGAIENANGHLLLAKDRPSTVCVEKAMMGAYSAVDVVELLGGFHDAEK